MAPNSRSTVFSASRAMISFILSAAKNCNSAIFNLDDFWAHVLLHLGQFGRTNLSSLVSEFSFNAVIPSFFKGYAAHWFMNADGEVFIRRQRDFHFFEGELCLSRSFSLFLTEFPPAKARPKQTIISVSLRVSFHVLVTKYLDPLSLTRFSRVCRALYAEVGSSLFEAESSFIPSRCQLVESDRVRARCISILRQRVVLAEARYITRDCTITGGSRWSEADRYSALILTTFPEAQSTRICVYFGRDEDDGRPQFCYFYALRPSQVTILLDRVNTIMASRSNADHREVKDLSNLQKVILSTLEYSNDLCWLHVRN